MIADERSMAILTRLSGVGASPDDWFRIPRSDNSPGCRSTNRSTARSPPGPDDPTIGRSRSAIDTAIRLAGSRGRQERPEIRDALAGLGRTPRGIPRFRPAAGHRLPGLVVQERRGRLTPRGIRQRHERRTRSWRRSSSRRFADNALLIAATMLAQLDGPPWLTPLLKFFFTISRSCSPSSAPSPTRCRRGA